MNTEDVMEVLLNINVGTIVAWVVVIFGLFTTVSTGAIKIYKIFDKYKKSKEKSEKLENTIKNHEDALTNINETLKQIQESLDMQKDVNLKQIRHTMVQTCEEVIERGEISTNKLCSLEEMYTVYKTVFNGNGYVSALIEKVRLLPISKQFSEGG